MPALNAVATWLNASYNYLERKARLSGKEKLVRRLRSRPKDFTFDEAVALLSLLGYALDNKGKTSGSRVKFVNSETGHKIFLHKPHPRNYLLEYQVRRLVAKLEEGGAI